MTSLPRPGLLNLITDVPGLTVGHVTDDTVRSGATVLRTDGFWAAAVDVRGGGPGTRETEALAPENLVGRVHAIALAGGSVFGLAIADGVVAALSAQGQGLALKPGSPAIPVVPAAVLHDLGNGGDKAWGLEPPYRRWGIEAVAAAAREFALGRVGAGRGAMAGHLPGGWARRHWTWATAWWWAPWWPPTPSARSTCPTATPSGPGPSRSTASSEGTGRRGTRRWSTRCPRPRAWPTWAGCSRV